MANGLRRTFKATTTKSRAKNMGVGGSPIKSAFREGSFSHLPDHILLRSCIQSMTGGQIQEDCPIINVDKVMTPPGKAYFMHKMSQYDVWFISGIQ